MTVEIWTRALERADDRRAFHSGDEALDLYFHKYAGKNPFRHHVGVTYVVVEGGRVLGLSPSHQVHWMRVTSRPVEGRPSLPRAHSPRR